MNVPTTVILFAFIHVHVIFGLPSSNIPTPTPWASAAMRAGGLELELTSHSVDQVCQNSGLVGHDVGIL